MYSVGAASFRSDRVRFCNVQSYGCAYDGVLRLNRIRCLSILKCSADGVRRVYCDMKLNMKRRAERRLATRDPQPSLSTEELNRVWALDFVRDTLYDGRPFER